MALTDKVAPDTGTRFEGHRQGPFGGQSSLGAKPTRQLRELGGPWSFSDKATPRIPMSPRRWQQGNSGDWSGPVVQQRGDS